MLGTRGFTLLEMVVVLALIALATALVAPRFVGPTRSPRPPLVLFLETQRSLAIEQGHEIRVYELAGQFSSDPSGASYTLLEHTHLDLRWPAPSIYQARHLVAVFYPDGTSIVSDFDLVSEGATGYPDQRLHISISPMQGEVAYGS